MTKAEKILQKMRMSVRNWRIEEIKTLAKRYGMNVRNPRGSHVIFSHPSVTEIF